VLPGEAPASELHLQPQSSPGARQVRRSFCRPDTNCREYTSVAIQAYKVFEIESFCRDFKRGTGAVSRYKLTMKPRVSQGTQVLLGAAAGIRVYIVLLICQDSRNSMQKL